MMELALVFSSLNVVALLALLYLYGRIALRSRAAYSVGLTLFALLLLLQNAVTAFSYIEMTPFFGDEVVPYLATISVLEFGGLVALTKVTL
jgi:hypothetical protein